MDEVAERSGVSKQTIYTHFGSKQTLFVELVSAMTGEAMLLGDEAIAPPEQLRRHAAEATRVFLAAHR